MDRLHLTLLGGFEARVGDAEAVVFPRKKAQALLAYLALHPDQAHPRGKLASLLWGETRDAEARGSLRQALVAIRRALPRDRPLLVADQDVVRIDAGVHVDVREFERLAKDATPGSLAAAADLYRGDLLAGLDAQSAEFEQWLLAARERLREMALEVLARLLAQQRDSGALEPATQTALRILSIDPLQEAVHRVLMRLYAAQGRRGAALRQYQACVDIVRRELGAEPEAETRALYREILQTRERVISPRVEPPARDTGVLDTSPLIGRAAELAALRTALDEARSGRGRVVAIVGEAGIGKTTVLRALAAEATDRGARVLLGRSYESERILAFGPWIDAFRAGQVVADEELLGALEPVWRSELARLLPEVAVSGLVPPGGDARRLFEAVSRVVARLAGARPLVLLLEDVHWADEMTLRLVAFLARRTPDARVLIVLTAREEDLDAAPLLRRILGELEHEPHVTRLALAGLSAEDTAALVRSLHRPGGDREALARLEARAWKVSEGNPFVVVEMVRVLADRIPSAAPLPESVQALTESRLERLSERGRELAAVAAVIGREFDFALLQGASRLAEADAVEGVDELVRRLILHGVGEAFDFTHDRIREVVYGALLPPRRKLLHGDVAAALEALTAGALDPPAAALAMHYRHAEVWEKAALHLRQAGVQAAARSALAEARTWLEQALEAVEKLPQSRSTLEEAVDIRFELRPVLAQLVDSDGGMENLREAEALAGTLQDERRRGRVCAYMTNMQLRLGRLDEARASGTRALTIARQSGDLELRLLSSTFLGQVHHYCGEYEQQADLIARNVADLPADWVYKNFGIGVPISLFDRAQLVIGLAHLGRFTEAAGWEAEGIRLVESLDHPYTVAQPHMAASICRILKGDWTKARSLAERAVAALRTRNVPFLLATSIACSVWACAQLRETREAVDLLREAEQLLENARARTPITGPSGSTNGWAYQALGRACLLLDRLDDAQLLCDRAIETSPPGYAPYALHLLGDIAAHPDRFDAENGEAHYRQALALAEPRGMRPLVAHCHLGLGTLLQRTGKRTEAEQHLTTAATMYREMEMLFHLEQTESSLRR